MDYEPMPLRLETERLVLTPHEPQDAEWFAELLNARRTGTFTFDDALKRIERMTETYRTSGIARSYYAPGWAWTRSGTARSSSAERPSRSLSSPTSFFPEHTARVMPRKRRRRC